MPETIFDKILRKEIPVDVVYEDEDVLAFRDIHPQAPVHVLVIPKRRLSTLADATEEDILSLGTLLVRTAEIARRLGMAENGYRIVVNHGRDAGQEVLYLHIHLLGGRRFSWPPG